VNRQPQLLVEVEPLSDARWARMERELFAKLDEAQETDTRARDPRRFRALTWAAVAVTVASAMLAIVLSGRAMHPDDRVSLATTDSASEFTVGESSLTVAPRSLVAVRGDDDHGIDVVLDRGTVTCEVAPRRGRPPFRLSAGEVRIRVMGTKFTVTRGEEETSVDVEHGVVEIASRGVVTVVRDGGHWPDAVAPSGTPSSDVASSSSYGAGVPMAPLQARSQARAAHSRRPAAVDTSAASSEPTANEPVAMEPATTSPPATAVVPAAQQAFEAASRSERTNPVQAAAIYRQLAAGGTAWAPNALFALARLEVDRGQRAEAARLLSAYLVRYPRGINADDARELLRRMR
jgi:hypothetical protein